VSILKATHRVPGSSVVGAHDGTAAVEEEAARIGAANRTAPIEAVGTNIVDCWWIRTAVAREGQFKRGSKGSCAVVATTPT